MLVTKKTKHVTYKNNDWACHKNEEVQSVQMYICQSNTYRNNLRSTLSQGFKRDNKWRASCPTYPFQQHIQAAVRNTSQDTETVFHARLYGRLIETNSSLRRKKVSFTNIQCLCSIFIGCKPFLEWNSLILALCAAISL